MAETTEPANNPTEPTSPAAETTPTPVVEVPATQQQQVNLLGDQPKAEADKPATEEKPADTKPEGAPEKYEFTAPEGKEYDAAVLDTFSEAAKEANLTQDAAQKLLEKVAPALAGRHQEQVDAIRNQWVVDSKADKEFGGDKLQENLGIAKKALDTFGSPEFSALLKDSGMGNHPELIRTMYRIGKAISEDSFVSGQPNNKANLNPATVLYDNTKKE
jgi:hypothetical protein